VSELRRSHKIAFGIGQLAEGVKNSSFELFLFFYYNQVLGLAGTLAGAAVAVALVFDAITDPMAGSLSDSLHSRWGRRHPFMYASAVPLAIFFYFVFNPPAGLGQEGLFAWLCAFTILTRAAMTLYHVPHLALGAELSDDYQERTNIVAYRVFFGLTGVMLASVGGLLVFLPRTPDYPLGQLNPAGYSPLSITFAVLMVVTIFWSAIGTHSRIPYLARPPQRPPPFSFARMFGEMREALSIASFRALFAGLVIFFVMRGIQMTLGLHVSTHFWVLGSAQIALLTGVGGVGVLLGIPVFTRMSRRLDKKPTFLLGVVWFSGFHILPIVMKLWLWFPAPESPAYLGALAVCGFLASFGAAAGLVTAGSMLADIADQHELENGRRQEVIFFGAQSFSAKAASGLGHLIAGVAIDLIHFPLKAQPGTVPPQTVRELAIIYGPGILVLAVISVAFLARYRITRESHAAVATSLARRRAGAVGPAS
jgi:Na+/melibiose symporter-like transporter